MFLLKNNAQEHSSGGFGAFSSALPRAPSFWERAGPGEGEQTQEERRAGWVRV